MTSPDVVMFIRHGEKPGSDGPPHGVNHHGEHDEHSLSVRGWTRAGGLANLLASAPSPSHPDVVVPERIFATRTTHSYRSHREVDTANPLARRLDIEIDAQYDHSEGDALSRSILDDPRPALVVWHHGSMSDLVGLFPISNASDVPARWPDDRFDLIWVLTRDAEESDYRFSCVTQGLLDGDAPSS